MYYPTEIEKEIREAKLKQAIDEAIGEVAPLRFIGRFDFKDLSKADMTKGNLAVTDNASYIGTGEKWVCVSYNEVARFDILDRVHIWGRGYVYMIDNSEGVPITMVSEVINLFKHYPIKGIEKHGDDEFGVNPKWGICLSHKIKGDVLRIQLNGDYGTL